MKGRKKAQGKRSSVCWPVLLFPTFGFFISLSLYFSLSFSCFFFPRRGLPYIATLYQLCGGLFAWAVPYFLFSYFQPWLYSVMLLFCFHSNVVMTNATATGAIEWQQTFIARAISYFPLLHTNTHGRKLGTVKLSSKIGIASRRERGMTPNYYGVGNLFLVFSTARYHATTSVMGPFFFRLFWNRFLFESVLVSRLLMTF